jgi:dienelactone hydrolase
MKLAGITQCGYRRTRWDRTRHNCMRWIRYLKGGRRFDGAKTYAGSLSPRLPMFPKFSANHDDGPNGRTGAKPTRKGVSRSAAFAHGPPLSDVGPPRESLLVASSTASLRIDRRASRASLIVGVRLPIVCMLTSVMLVALAVVGAAPATERTALVREELWAIPAVVPMLAYVIRPPGDGPNPLVVMNHGVSLDPTERSYFPLIEFREAALWFARQGYVVVAPVRSGYGLTGIEIAHRGIFGVFFSSVGRCSDPQFRDAGLAVAAMDGWVIDYLTKQPFVDGHKVIIVGQSGGGWGAIALASQNPEQVRAVIAFAAGRGGHLDGKPNNNCAPDRLVETTGEFGRTARVPMLWIYTENDTYFGPALSQRMARAFQAEGGNLEYHLLPSFGDDGHFLVDSRDGVGLWAPLVSDFLARHR